jgi:IMP dehydrogenase
MVAADLLKKMGRSVFSMESERTVDDAVNAMTANKTSALIVTENDRPVGIFAERDVLRTYLRDKAKAFADVKLADAMTADLITAHADDTIDTAIGVMLKAGIGHLPVMSGDKIIGMLTANALVEHRLAALEDEMHHLKEYIADLHDAGTD